MDNKISRYAPGPLMIPPEDPFPIGGFVGRKLQKWMLEDQVKIAEFKNKIAQFDLGTHTARVTKFIENQTIFERLELAQDTIQYQKDCFKIDKQSREATVLGLLLDNELKKEKVEQAKMETKSQSVEIEEKLRVIKEYMSGVK